MRIALTAQGAALDDLLDPRFGRARMLLIVDEETGDVAAHDRSTNLDVAQGAGIRAAQEVAQLGAGALITGNVGPGAFRALKAAGISVFLAEDCTAAEALERFRRHEQTEQKDASGSGRPGAGRRPPTGG